MLCFCPLYPMGDRCGGSFTYTDKGVKSCVNCIRPHIPANYDSIMRQLSAAGKTYHSPYEAYPFLAEKSDDIRCDFEILTDRTASETGLLAAKIHNKDLKAELLRVAELIYHLNPTLRTHFSISDEEIEWLHEKVSEKQAASKGTFEKFVLPAGCETACIAHVLRVQCKETVRMMYRYAEKGGRVEDRAFDFANLLSGYFFETALELNRMDDIKETEFISRNYKLS